MFGYSNVFYESNSRYKFEELNETVFIQSVFDSLSLILDNFVDYNFFIFSSHSITTIPESCKSNLKNKILIYLSEEGGGIPSDDMLSAYYLIFKAHHDKSKHLNIKNLHPFPLGITKYIQELPVIPFNDRKINLFFSGNLNYNRYNLYFEFLRKTIPVFTIFKFSFKISQLLVKILFKFGIRKFNHVIPKSIVFFTDGFQKGYSPEEYTELLYDSKIVLSAKGFVVPECFRIYEAMRAGCIVISEKLPDVEFYNTVSIIQVENWNNVDKIIKGLLSDEDKMKELSDISLKHYKDFFSGMGVAQYIKRTIEII
jgi:hypothetical protein